MNRALIVLGLVLMLVSVFGCAMTPEQEWYLAGEPSKKVEWVKIPWRDLPGVCGDAKYMSQRVVACAVQIRQTSTCYIFSGMAEHEAHYFYTSHMDDLWSHERRHCEGWRH